MMSAPARWEYLKAIHGRYRQAARMDKGPILDEFCCATGYHRNTRAVARIRFLIRTGAGRTTRHSRGIVLMMWSRVFRNLRSS
jgi:hypothetical protein